MTGAVALLQVLGCSSSAGGAPRSLPFALVEVGRVVEPTALATTPGGAEALWAAEQAGRIVRVEVGGAVPVLDVRERVRSGGEAGLLGMAFAPTWPADPRVFVNYTFKSATGLNTRIASFTSTDGGATLAPGTEKSLLEFAQPWSNHNSGPLQFGPDGMLYVAIGDGGSGGDPHQTGQDRGDLLGSILRIDVTGASFYTIPPDNPFADQPGVRPEIWAYGLRNPWGMHFDGPTLWWADVGQHQREEIDRGVAGGNYGWNRKEGTRCYERTTCPGAFVEPVAEYGHDDGASVTGGLVYRGPSIPAIDGKYVFADFATGRFFAVPAAGGSLERLGDSGTNPSTFGRGRDGTLYVGDYRGGVYRISRPAPSP